MMKMKTVSNNSSKPVFGVRNDVSTCLSIVIKDLPVIGPAVRWVMRQNVLVMQTLKLLWNPYGVELIYVYCTFI